MRSLIMLFALSVLAGCKSSKDILSDNTLKTDSIARSENHRTIAVIDSVMRSTSFYFDTIEVRVERPTEYADKPEIIRLKATKGSVINRQSVRKNQLEAYNQLDTVAYKKSAAEASAEHSATTRIYNPPDGTAMFVVSFIVIGALLYVFIAVR